MVDKKCKGRPQCKIINFDYSNSSDFICCCFCKKYKTCEVACRDDFKTCNHAVDKNYKEESKFYIKEVKEEPKSKGRPKKEITQEDVQKAVQKLSKRGRPKKND